jgi:hypothetical protein
MSSLVVLRNKLQEYRESLDATANTFIEKSIPCSLLRCNLIEVIKS